ncbi:hypothetical protein AAAU98_22640 [Enterocloster citroniae]|nr:hypothetical protein [Enterocloster citroniae]
MTVFPANQTARSWLLDILILTLMHQQTGSADSSRYPESLRARYASLIKR